MSLRGHAQSVLGDLPCDKGQHYSTLVRSLEEKFPPPKQTDLYRVQLKERKQKALESILVLGQTFRRLTNLAYASAPGEVLETLANDSFIDDLTYSEMRIRIKQSRPQKLNEAICLAVELKAYNRAERQIQISKGHLRVSNTEQTTPVTTSEATETSMEAWMKSMDANMNALTNEIKQVKTRESARKRYDRKSGDRQGCCHGCNKEGHIKRNCPNVKKRPCENEPNNAKKGSSRPVRSNVQPV